MRSFHAPLPLTDTATMGRRATWWTAVAGLGAALTVHFALVLLHVLPPNPISGSLGALAHAYVVPRFAQDWRLFAPIPVTNDYTAYARGTYASQDGERTTEWLDFSTPVIRAVQTNRLSPMNFRLTMLLTAMYDVTNRAASAKGIFRAQLIQQWADPATRPASLVVLETSGAAALAAAHPGRAFRRVEVMIAMQPPLPFANRYALESERSPREELAFPPVPFPRVAEWGPVR